VNSAVDSTSEEFRGLQPLAKHKSYPTSFLASNASLVKGNLSRAEFSPSQFNITLTNQTREVNVTFRFQNISRPIPLAPNNILSNYSIVMNFFLSTPYVTNSSYMEVLQYVDGNATTVSSWITVPDLIAETYVWNDILEPTRQLDSLNVRFRFVYNDTTPITENFQWSLTDVRMDATWRWENVPMKNLAFRNPELAVDDSGAVSIWLHQQNEHMTVPVHDIDYYFLPCMLCIFGGVGPIFSDQTFDRDYLTTTDITNVV